MVIVRILESVPGSCRCDLCDGIFDQSGFLTLALMTPLDPLDLLKLHEVELPQMCLGLLRLHYSRCLSSICERLNVVIVHDADSHGTVFEFHADVLPLDHRRLFHGLRHLKSRKVPSPFLVETMLSEAVSLKDSGKVSSLEIYLFAGDISERVSAFPTPRSSDSISAYEQPTIAIRKQNDHAWHYLLIDAPVVSTIVF